MLQIARRSVLPKEGLWQKSWKKAVEAFRDSEQKEQGVEACQAAHVASAGAVGVVRKLQIDLDRLREHLRKERAAHQDSEKEAQALRSQMTTLER